MSDVVEQIANRVRGASAEKRLTQQRIADALGLARGSVNARMNGQTPFTAAELWTIGHTFGIEVSRFFPLTSSPVSTSPEADETAGTLDARRPVPDAVAAGVTSVRRAS